MIDLFIAVVLLALIIGSISDFKHHEVPDWLSFGLIFTGLGLRFVASANSLDWLILGSGILGLAICFLISLAMFYTGQWGGGDSKLLMGLGAMIGLDLNGFPTLAIFLINTLVLGGFYGMGFSIYLGIKHKREFAKEIKHTYSNQTIRLFSLLSVLSLITSIILFFTINNASLNFLILALAIIFVIAIHTFIFMKSVEKVSMFKEKSIKELTEGDWIAKNIFVKGKRLAGPKDLGISKKQIALLKRYKIRKVLVKEGIPFVPSFLLGYLATLGIGNWIIFLL